MYKVYDFEGDDLCFPDPINYIEKMPDEMRIDNINDVLEDLWNKLQVKRIQKIR